MKAAHLGCCKWPVTHGCNVPTLLQHLLLGKNKCLLLKSIFKTIDMLRDSLLLLFLLLLLLASSWSWFLPHFYCPVTYFSFLLESSFFFSVSQLGSVGTQGCRERRRNPKRRVSTASQVTGSWESEDQHQKVSLEKPEQETLFGQHPQIEPCIERTIESQTTGQEYESGHWEAHNPTTKNLLFNILFTDIICPSEYSLEYISLIWHLLYKNWRVWKCWISIFHLWLRHWITMAYHHIHSLFSFIWILNCGVKSKYSGFHVCCVKEESLNSYNRNFYPNYL